MGDTDIELPESTNPPPQPLEYHLHEAPVPNDPPDTLNVVELPLHIIFWLAEALVGEVDCVPIATVTLAQEVVLQSPSALT